ncbi:hypothetical protein GDO78_003790 [Eleutherodactylus coqui]|uniref:Uncharacterized protein n=1 Tax=Eleutherodactylus coqui TaxID=57060 RepID=A0A8J6EUW7_ELECQ|nr:hypothetical protein GDO78_003790 [Eleutherodactylus coqui]
MSYFLQHNTYHHLFLQQQKCSATLEIRRWKTTYFLLYNTQKQLRTCPEALYEIESIRKALNWSLISICKKESGDRLDG